MIRWRRAAGTFTAAGRRATLVLVLEAGSASWATFGSGAATVTLTGAFDCFGFVVLDRTVAGGAITVGSGVTTVTLTGAFGCFGFVELEATMPAVSTILAGFVSFNRFVVAGVSAVIVGTDAASGSAAGGGVVLALADAAGVAGALADLALSAGRGAGGLASTGFSSMGAAEGAVREAGLGPVPEAGEPGLDGVFTATESAVVHGAGATVLRR